MTNANASETERLLAARRLPPFPVAELNEIAAAAGHVFSKPELAVIALTHSSAWSQTPNDNQRLEFLGDSVIGLCVVEHLYRTFPNFTEGDLTRIKSQVVSTESLADCARKLELRRFMRLGRGLASAENLSDSVCADIFESFTGAVYLDSDMETARAFILRMLTPLIAAAARSGGDTDYKSQLQRLSQKKFRVIPNYSLVAESGPDHNKTFEVAARIGNRRFSLGAGTSKKIAEQQAAKKALDAILQSDTNGIVFVDYFGTPMRLEEAAIDTPSADDGLGVPVPSPWRRGRSFYRVRGRLFHVIPRICRRRGLDLLRFLRRRGWDYIRRRR